MVADAPAAFFSYCREDSDFALRLAQDLKAAGASVWIDQLNLVGGQLWDRAIEDALNNCPLGIWRHDRRQQIFTYHALTGHSSRLRAGRGAQPHF